MSVHSAESSQEYFGRRSRVPSRLSRDVTNPTLNEWLTRCELKRKQLLNKPFLDDKDYESTEQVDSYTLLRKEFTRRKGLRWFLIDPNGLFRRIWDCLALVQVCMDVIFVPVWIAYYETATTCTMWDLNPSGSWDGEAPAAELGAFIGATEVYQRIFFAVDIVLNFLTGVPLESDKGLVVYDPRVICRRYLSSWFVLDVVACVPLHCIFLLADRDINWFNIGYLIRLLRVFTIRRRAHGTLMSWVEVATEKYGIFNKAYRNLGRISLITFFVMHVFACFAWWICRIQDFPNNPSTSIIVWPVMLDIVMPVNVALQYLWSFVYAVSTAIQNTWGPFPPITWPEAVYWEVGMLVITVVWVMFNATLTVAFLGPQNASYNFRMFMDEAQEVLDCMSLPPDDVSKVKHNLSAKYKGRKTNETLVADQLPYHLLGEIAVSLYGKYIKEFPPFNIEPMVLEFVASRVRRVTFLEDHVIIAKKFPLQYIYFIRDGLVGLKYQGDYSTWAKSANKNIVYSFSRKQSRTKLATIPGSFVEPSSAPAEQDGYRLEDIDSGLGEFVRVKEGSAWWGGKKNSSFSGVIKSSATSLSSALNSRMSSTLDGTRKVVEAAKDSVVGTIERIASGQKSGKEAQRAKDRLSGLVEVLGPLQYFGESALFGAPPRIAVGQPLGGEGQKEDADLPMYNFNACPFSAVALADCELLLVKYDDVAAVQHVVPAFNRILKQTALRYWTALEEWVPPDNNPGDGLWGGEDGEQNGNSAAAKPTSSSRVTDLFTSFMDSAAAVTDSFVSPLNRAVSVVRHASSSSSYSMSTATSSAGDSWFKSVLNRNKRKGSGVSSGTQRKGSAASSGTQRSVPPQPTDKSIALSKVGEGSSELGTQSSAKKPSDKSPAL